MTKKTVPQRKGIDGGLVILVSATVIAGVLVAWREGMVHAAMLTVGALGFLGLLLPKIVAGLFIASAVPILLPRDRISGLIGHDSGVRGLVFATMAGAVLPGGPSMAYPLSAALMASGADLGASLAFLSGWSLFNLNRTLIWEMSFLDADIVGLRVSLCLVFPLIIGAMARRLVRP